MLSPFDLMYAWNSCNDVFQLAFQKGTTLIILFWKKEGDITWFAKQSTDLLNLTATKSANFTQVSPPSLVSFQELLIKAGKDELIFTGIQIDEKSLTSDEFFNAACNSLIHGRVIYSDSTFQWTARESILEECASTLLNQGEIVTILPVEWRFQKFSIEFRTTALIKFEEDGAFIFEPFNFIVKTANQQLQSLAFKIQINLDLFMEGRPAKFLDDTLLIKYSF